VQKINLDLIHTSMWQYKLQHIVGMSSTVIKDSLLHNCRELSRIAWNYCLRQCVSCSYSGNLPTTTGLRVTYKWVIFSRYDAFKIILVKFPPKMAFIKVRSTVWYNELSWSRFYKVE